MRIHYLQHVSFEGLGSIEAWIRRQSFELSSTLFFDGERVPADIDFDALIIMGGPMGVRDVGEFPWIRDEIALIEKAIDSGVKVLGICLGAQLIAAALGARVYKNAEKEVGWFPIERTRGGVTHPLFSNLPDIFTCFHWHSDTFDLPRGARHLARSVACEHQAFSIGTTTLGLQFHPEFTADSIHTLTQACGANLREDRFVQSAEDFSNVSEGQISAGNDIMNSLLDNFFL